MTKGPRFMKEYSSTDLQKKKTNEVFVSAGKHPVIISRKARGENPAGQFVLMKVSRYDRLTADNLK